MEQWQMEALQALLETETKEVEEGSRVYVSSQTYGDSRFHLLSKKYDSVQIEQTNIDEKWGSRVQLQNDELPAALKTLLIWYLGDVRQHQGTAAVGVADDDDALGGNLTLWLKSRGLYDRISTESSNMAASLPSTAAPDQHCGSRHL